MSRSRWSIAAAKAELSNVVRCAQREPQVLENRGEPVAVVLGIDEYRRTSERETAKARWCAFLDRTDAMAAAGGAFERHSTEGGTTGSLRAIERDTTASLMYLLDTNVISELARPRPDPKVRAWVRSLDGALLSVITIEEIVFRHRTSAARAQAEPLRLVRGFAPQRRRDARRHARHRASGGELRAKRSRGGRPVAQADMLIAATAIVHGLTLATRNVADFKGCDVVVFDPFA